MSRRLFIFLVVIFIVLVGGAVFWMVRIRMNVTGLRPSVTAPSSSSPSSTVQEGGQIPPSTSPIPTTATTASTQTAEPYVLRGYLPIGGGGFAGTPPVELSTPTPLETKPVTTPTTSAPEPDKDTDHDGLTDEEERRIGTDPNVADTDGDGLTDGDEVRKYRTNPRTVDTDRDGLSDGDEVLIYKTNPNLADTDGDGFSDGVEVSKGYNPLGPGKK